MKADNKNPRVNGSGYYDPTAYEALKSILSKEKPRDKQVHQAVTIIKNLLKFWDMRLENRMHIRDKKTGKVYR